MLLSEPHLLAMVHFAMGLVLGSAFYRADFCIAGMLRDLFLFRDGSMLRPLLLAVILTMFLFLAARAAGVLPYDPPPSYGSRVTLLAVAGGLLFGVGMVLAGGCVVGTLYKMGGGSPVSFIAFGGLVAGSLLYAEIHPVVKAWAQATMLTPHVTLHQGWPLAGTLAGWAAVLAAIPVLAVWWRQGKLVMTNLADGYLQPWRVAVLVAALNGLHYLLSGWPIGISTAYAKIGSYLESLVAREHVAQLAYFRDPSLVVQTPAGLLTGGPGPRVDLIFQTELTLLLGIVAGAFLTAVALREFRFHGLPPRAQGLCAFGGGILMALGARMASGCTIKFILGGLPILSLQAMLFIGGLLAGALLGACLLRRVVLGGPINVVS